MGDRGLESEGLAGELNKNEDVDAGRHFEEEKVVNLKWIVEQGKGGEERTGGKSVVGGLRDPVLANLIHLRSQTIQENLIHNGFQGKDEASVMQGQAGDVQIGKKKGVLREA